GAHPVSVRVCEGMPRPRSPIAQRGTPPLLLPYRSEEGLQPCLLGSQALRAKTAIEPQNPTESPETLRRGTSQGPPDAMRDDSAPLVSCSSPCIVRVRDDYRHAV